MIRLFVLPGLLGAAPVWGHSITGSGVATLARLDVDVDGIRGSYEVQYGPASALDLRRAIDADGDGELSFDEQRVYLDSMATRCAAGLTVSLGDSTLAVRLRSGELLPRGEWAAVPVRSTVVFDLEVPASALPGARTRLRLVDGNELAGALHRTAVITTLELVDIEIPRAATEATPASGSLKGVQFQGPGTGVTAAVDLELSAQARHGLTGAQDVAAGSAGGWDWPAGAGALLTAAVCGGIVGFGLAAALLEGRRRRA